jgi:hypothetical protein
MTLAGITVLSLRFKQMVKLCHIHINLHDKNELFMKLGVNIRQQAFVLISYAQVTPVYTVIKIRLQILNIPQEVYSGAARIFRNLTNEIGRHFI